MIRIKFLPVLFILALVSCQNDDVSFYPNVKIRVWQLEQPAVRAIIYNADTIDLRLINTEAQVFQFTSTFQSEDSISMYFLTVPTEQPQNEFLYSILHDGTVLDGGSSKQIDFGIDKAQEVLKTYVFE